MALLCAALELVSRALRVDVNPGFDFFRCFLRALPPTRLWCSDGCTVARPGSKALNSSAVSIANCLECRDEFFGALANTFLGGKSFSRFQFRIKDAKSRARLHLLGAHGERAREASLAAFATFHKVPAIKNRQ